MASGWLVLGDNQRLRGYSLLLSDPVALDITALAPEPRAALIRDMVIIGDALMEVTDSKLINYLVLGNLDRALHAHIHPRYQDAPPETRQQGPWAYHNQDVPFDLSRDRDLMERLGQARFLFNSLPFSSEDEKPLFGDSRRSTSQ